MIMGVEAEVGCESESDNDNGRVKFENLPEGCIANVLSFTTPRDACALSLVSSTFRSAAQSDVVWDRFLPSDYGTIIPTSSCFPSKKDLCLYLSQNPILIDDGQKSFVLDKVYGKKCYMLSARILFIVWSDTPRYWRWTCLPDSRFSEVAELVSVCWLEIRGKIKTCMLSPETLYGAYLVFKPSAAGSYGFEHQPVEVSIGIADEGHTDTRNRTVYLDAPRPRRPRYQAALRILNRSRSRLLPSVEEAQAQAQAPPPPPPVHPARVGVEFPKERGDGWWEIELGDFFNKGGDDKEVEMGVYEVKSGDWKGGILLQGIEIRPKLNNPITLYQTINS